MKISFQNTKELESGIALLAGDLGIEIVTKGAELTVAVREVEGHALNVTLDGTTAEIVYGGGKARFFRGLATVCG